MKKVLILPLFYLGYVALCADAEAFDFRVVETVRSSWTVQGVTISTIAATQMPSMPDRKLALVQNVGASDVHCGGDSNVSGTAANQKVGIQVAVGGSVSLPLESNLDVYCISATTESARVVWAQLK